MPIRSPRWMRVEKPLTMLRFSYDFSIPSASITSLPERSAGPVERLALPAAVR
jgi:hypothetical protein